MKINKTFNDSLDALIIVLYVCLIIILLQKDMKFLGALCIAIVIFYSQFATNRFKILTFDEN